MEKTGDRYDARRGHHGRRRGSWARALRQFPADGFTVYAADRAVMPLRPGLDAVTLDVTDRAAVVALAERAGREKRLEAWINGAGVFLACPVLEAGAQD